VMFGCFPVMTSSMRVVFRCFAMMLGRFLRHKRSPGFSGCGPEESSTLWGR
jgi:hypothetical protein